MKDWFSTINYLMIEANSQCNLRCQSCSRERLVAEGMRNPVSITEEKLIFLLDQLKNCPIKTIKFEGLSEPFLHPQFARLCEIMKNYFPQVHLIVITNLQYGIANVDFVKVAELAGAIYISIDGTDEVYEQLRTGARWSLALKNLSYVKESLSEEQRNKVFINFTVSEQNYLELPKIYELKKSFGLSGVRINLIQNWEEDKLNNNQFPSAMMDFLKDYVSDLKGAKNWDYESCFWPFNGLIIDVEGRVRQCVLNTTQKMIANAFETPLEKIYNENGFFNNLRQSLSNNISPESCRNCDYKNLASSLNQLFQEAGQEPKKKIIPF